MLDDNSVQGSIVVTPLRIAFYFFFPLAVLEIVSSHLPYLQRMAFNYPQQWGSQLLIRELSPIERLKESMLLDFSEPLRAKPILWIELEQSYNKVPQLLTQRIVLPFATFLELHHNVFKPTSHQNLIFAKWRLTCSHLIKQYSQLPKVYLPRVPFLEDHLWGKIKNGANLSPCLISVIQYFRKAKVSELDVAILEDDEILRFEVPVDDVVLMKVFQTQYNTASNKSNPFVSQLLELTWPHILFILDFPQAKKTFNWSSNRILHCQINKLIISEGEFEGSQEGVIELSHYNFLKHRTLLYFLISKARFIDFFQCQLFTRLLAGFELNEIHTSEVS